MDAAGNTASGSALAPTRHRVENSPRIDAKVKELCDNLCRALDADG